MKMLPLSFRCFAKHIGLSFTALALSGGMAHAKLDLDRVDPVAPTETIPVGDFFRPAMFSAPKINPGGTHVAALSSGGFERNQLIIFDLVAGESLIVEGMAGMDMYDFRWLNDERLIFEAYSDVSRSNFLLAVNLDGLGSPYPLIQRGEFQVIGVPPDDRTHPLAWVVASEVTDPKGEVVVLDTDVDTASILDRSPNQATSADGLLIEQQNKRAVSKHLPFLDFGIRADYWTDRNGELAYGRTIDAGLYTLYRFNDNRWREVPVDMETLALHGPGEQDNQILVSHLPYNGEPSPVHFLDMTTGELGLEVLRDKAYDFNGSVIRDPGSRRLVGLEFHRATPVTVWFDDGYKSVYDTFKQNFPKQILRIVSVDDAANMFVLETYSDRNPSTFHIANLAERSVGPLKTSRPWLNPDRLARTSIIKFKTAEGHNLDAYLTIPAGFSQDNPGPLVVLPHNGVSLDGTWTRDYLGFHEKAQFLASRGYAVLQPNYRGSPGTNWMFPEADQWDFLKMHDDVTRATKTALRTKFFDPSRIAIMGKKFGAYLALSGGVHEPDLYRCIVGSDGFYDWAEIMRDGQYDRYSSGTYSRLAYKLGNLKKEAAKYERISPANFVANLKAPVLVTQGKDNPAITRLESRRLVSALKKAGKSHESIVTDREGEDLLDLENRVEVYQKIEAFLAKNL